MSTTVRTCPDGHRCYNGSSCAEHPIQEGKYYCDCGTSGGDFAGLFCEYKAETYCELREETTSDWFCTNGGTCVLSTGGSEAQWDCDCPDKNYEGPHCQFVSGNVPNDWPGFDFDPVTGTMTNAKHSKRRSGGGAAGIHFGIYIFIGLVVAALLALMGFFVMRKIRNRRGEIGDAKQNATRDHSEAVNKLEADGSVLHGALAQFARAPNATLQQQQQQQQQQEREPFDAASIANGSSDEAPVEVGFYTDKPRRNGNRHGHHASRDIL
mmetsp:Transcript_21195/g.50085  ORF Transcript_21195/g.50085 Transcript_21195/m.50085 type:complete len:267 (+) Transcript_21195:402-1202(+)